MKRIGQIREWQAEYPMVIPESKDGVLHPQYVLSELNKIAKEDAVIVTDVGQHQMWAAQFLTHKTLIPLLHLVVQVPWAMVYQLQSGLKWGTLRNKLSLLLVMVDSK